MKKARKFGKNSRVSLVLGLMILISGLFLATRAIEKIQDNRSSAASYDSTSGSCYLYSTFLPNKKVYMTNGSTFCDKGGGLISNGWIYKCVSGQKVKNTSCNGGDNSGCMETKGALVADTNGIAYYKYSAKCRNDLACTNSGGTCNVSIKNGPGVGKECTTSDGKKGIVKSDLCLSKTNMSTKRCCMPVATVTYYFYNPLNKTCESTSQYTSLTACNSAKRSACYTSLSSCKSSFSKCTSGNGTCILTSSGCSGGSFKSGLCPGNTSIKCCVK
ncbi:MAG: hypothetical protein PHX34_02040 [Candidatus Shapirobacteria bacterium]|nr:hypothetical protein [Candidatus Shapirobacteria bacterium]